MVQQETVKRLVEEWVENTPFFLVDIRISNENDILVEFESEEDEVCIDDCVDLSKFLEEQLDREKEDFSLEVGSAGLGQPFKVLKQFLINLGEEVEVILKSGKKFTGILKDANENGFTVSVSRKIKTEGVKKPMTVDADETYAHSDAKSVRYLIRFS